MHYDDDIAQLGTHYSPCGHQSEVRYRVIIYSTQVNSLVKLAIIRISCPAIDPFAPRSTRADHPIQDVFLSPVLLVEVWLMENVWSFTADGGTLRG